ANQRHRGAALYNEDYLGIATQFYGARFGVGTGRDGFRALSTRFHSFRDVIRFDPLHIAAQYPVNLAMSVVKSAGPWPPALGTAMGLFAPLRNRRSKSVAVLLVTLALFFSLMALNHFEPRYYLLVTTIYLGFSALAIEVLIRWLVERTPRTSGTI